MIGDAIYDYADRNPVRIPPPVGGVNNNEFYNAEDHTYAAVSKKDRAKKMPASGEGNSS